MAGLWGSEGSSMVQNFLWGHQKPSSRARSCVSDCTALGQPETMNVYIVER
jgi:hypothetical protein